MRAFLRLFLLLGLLIAGGGAAEAARFRTVVIDAGHGAHDFGAQRGYVFEKHLALDMARRLERFLRREGFQTVMTRSSDRFVPLDGRSHEANASSSSILVSIHANWAPRSSPSGVETFYYSGEGARLARLVQNQIIRNTNHGGDRGVKFARFRVLRTCARPAILVEAGFVSNEQDRERLLDPRYREAIAQSIGLGIIQYRRS